VPSPTIFDVVARHTPRTRARDSDRSRICQLLDTALAEGQLTMEEHRHRVAAATSAATLGELNGLLSDLQLPDAARTPPAGRMMLPRWALVAVAAVVLVLAVVIGWAMFAGTTPDRREQAPTATAESPAAPSTTPHPGAQPDDVAPSVLNMPKQLHTLGGMTGLLEQMRQRFGDTTGIELAIFPDSAMLFRPDPADPQQKLLYRFNAGWGDPTPRPRDEEDDVADLGAFDVKAVADVLRGAPETLGVAPDDVSEIVVDIDHIADPAGPGALDLLVKVDRKSGGSGFLYLDSAGNTKRVEYPS
jgi:hypothetical protein